MSKECKWECLCWARVEEIKIVKDNNSNITNKYALLNNIQNDIFRVWFKLLWYLLAVGFWYLLSHYIETGSLDVTCIFQTVIPTTWIE